MDKIERRRSFDHFSVERYDLSVFDQEFFSDADFSDRFFKQDPIVGDHVVFGGQVGVGGHLTIGDRAKAVGQSGITNSVEADQFVSGYPAIDNREWRRSSAVFPKLPEMRKQLRALEERLKALEEITNNK